MGLFDYLTKLNPLNLVYTENLQPEGEIQSLPKEIIEILLGEVKEPSNTSLVCKKWRSVEQDPIFVLKIICNQPDLAYFFTMALQMSPEPKKQVEHIKGMLERRCLSKLTVPQQQWVDAPERSVLKVIQFLSRFEHAKNLIRFWKVLNKEKTLTNTDFSDQPLLEQAQKVRACLSENQPMLEQIKEFHFSNRKLTSIPEEINLLTGLRTLRIGSSRLVAIPENFARTFNHLNSLTIQSTQITTLPPKFGELWNELETLDLAGNKLSKLPETFCTSWPKIRVIYLDSNKLKDVPEKIGEAWKNLRKFFITGNNLSTMPHSFLEKCLNLHTFKY